ncbi:hypothetical protein D6745_04180 [Candidatus Woesearchaeota archaeon]|nr:MAG: hypothetical protein D6745_04180 [Candidatus Woesearchaeota archaeon]
MLLPTKVPRDIPYDFFISPTAEVVSSGRAVLTPITRDPMREPLMPNLSVKNTAIFITRSAEKIKTIIPIIIMIKSAAKRAIFLWRSTFPLTSSFFDK